jgi:hypothetical protein
MKKAPRRWTAIISSQSASVTSKPAREAKTRIVDADIDAAVRHEDAGDGFVDRGRVAYVEPLRVRRQALGLRLRGDALGVSLYAHSRNNDGSRLSKRDRQLAPDALRGPGNDDDTIAQIEPLHRGAKRWGLIFAIRHLGLPFRDANDCLARRPVPIINPAQRDESRVQGLRRRSRTDP